MWLTDLEMAIAVIKEAYPTTLYTKIVPCYDGGIVFYTTYETHIKWYPDGHIEEHSKHDWRNGGYDGTKP